MTLRQRFLTWHYDRKIRKAKEHLESTPDYKYKMAFLDARNKVEMEFANTYHGSDVQHKELMTMESILDRVQKALWEVTSAQISNDNKEKE